MAADDKIGPSHAVKNIQCLCFRVIAVSCACGGMNAQYNHVRMLFCADIIHILLYAWGDLAYGMTFILDQPKRPITAGIFNFMGQYGTKWSYLSAFAVVSMIPVAIIFVFMQKYIIAGMTSGAVKG